MSVFFYVVLFVFFGFGFDLSWFGLAMLARCCEVCSLIQFYFRVLAGVVCFVTVLFSLCLCWFYQNYCLGSAAKNSKGSESVSLLDNVIAIEISACKNTMEMILSILSVGKARIALLNVPLFLVISSNKHRLPKNRANGLVNKTCGTCPLIWTIQ